MHQLERLWILQAMNFATVWHGGIMGWGRWVVRDGVDGPGPGDRRGCCQILSLLPGLKDPCGASARVILLDVNRHTGTGQGNKTNVLLHQEDLQQPLCLGEIQWQPFLHCYIIAWQPS